MNMIKKASAAIGVASLLACSASYAVSLDYGSVSAGEGFSFTQITSGSYSDSFSFTTDGVFDFVLSFTNVGFDSYSMVQVFVDGSATPITGAFGSGTAFSWSPSAFPTGTDFLVTVAGSDPTANPTYTLSLATAPVPEPSTWAMLGVGALAVAASIRRQQQRRS
ncbi:MAG: PEP-CTERM sorting domain-containing protein [Burkholderiales bacterium]|nr:PEP-CTERM sorting domain-containing protein [Burkholderiales bacterium]